MEHLALGSGEAQSILATSQIVDEMPHGLPSPDMSLAPKLKPVLVRSACTLIKRYRVVGGRACVMLSLLTRYHEVPEYLTGKERDGGKRQMRLLSANH